MLCRTFIANCAIKCNCHLEDIDLLIAKIKSASVENKTRQSKFDSCIFVTRWESWLNAALYYAKNFLEVKAIAKKF